MNVNGINDPEVIKANAKNILNAKQKVDLGKDDLEMLWKNAKLADESLSEIGLSDDDVIAQFDLLDNEDNTAAASYKLLLNWIKEQPKTEIAPAASKSAPAAANTAENAKQAEAPKSDSTQGQKTYVQLFGKESTTVQIDGKSYSFTNTSKTVNNFCYYVDKGTVVIEGSDLTMKSVEEGEGASDNVKFMGNRNTIDVGKGDDAIEVEGDMNSVFGGSGDDFIKMRGDYNTTNMGLGNDKVWIAGETNVAIGATGDDNFFAIGGGNTLYGQEDTDGVYYNDTKGVGHEYRTEFKITDGKDFEDWVNGTNPPDPGGPPYDKLPDALEGHEVRAYDDNTYTDKYEQTPNYITEYRDIAYRELSAETSVDRVDVGNATVSKYKDGEESEKITITPDTVTIKNGDDEVSIPAKDVVYKDKDGNVITNTGTIDNLVEMLATGKYTIDVQASTNPGEPVDPPVNPPVDPGEPNPPVDKPVDTPLEEFTPEAVGKLDTSYKTSLGDKIAKAGEEYSAAMANKKPDGTFDTSDDAAASQKYASVINQISVKENTLSSNVPMIETAVKAYGDYLTAIEGGASQTDDGKKLFELLTKVLKTLDKYMNNDDSENEDSVKAEFDDASKQLQEYMNK